ncbi:MAG: LysM peptidoglycan-binding domain-containing protein [Chloroflexi bacterium]|nr:LysM peptidoglycan-binding domain-containing protein [Chloroflexota bacterium]
MTGPTAARGRRVLTPAVTAAAAFAALSFLVSVAFVGVRGGLQLPVAATATPALAVGSPSWTPQPTVMPSMSPAETPSPTPVASAAPSAAPTASATPAATASPSGPPDPLLALPPCPDHPGCYLYTVRRGDSFTAVSDRFGLLLWITRALNPEVTNESVITIGQTLYLGRDPMARLAPCPDGAACHLYTVRSGDTLSTIAGRYGITTAGILALNPSLDPAVIVSGQVLRLPLYQG